MVLNILHMENFMTVKEFASKVSLHPNTIRKYIKLNILQSIKFTNGPKARHFIPESEIFRLGEIKFSEIVDKEVVRKILEKYSKDKIC